MLNTYLYMLIIGVCVLACIAWVGSRKKRQAQTSQKTSLEQITKIYGEVNRLGQVAYQGGLPEHPKPGFLQLAVNEDGLILYDGSGFHIQISAANCLEHDFFKIGRSASNNRKSTMLLGPFTQTLFKGKPLDMVSVRYIDSNRNDNHLLFAFDNGFEREATRSALMELRTLRTT